MSTKRLPSDRVVSEFEPAEKVPKQADDVMNSVEVPSFSSSPSSSSATIIPPSINDDNEEPQTLSTNALSGKNANLLGAPELPHQPRLHLSDYTSQESRTQVAGASSDPNYYKNACGYSAAENQDLEDIYRTWDTLVPAEDLPMLKSYVKGILRRNVKTPKDLEKAMSSIRKELKNMKRPSNGSTQNAPRKSEIIYAYSHMVAKNEINEDPILQRLLIKKASKSLSGVLVVTVLTSPYPEVDGKKQRFSCEWDCFYCPNEPGQPRSYLHDEPSVLRANRNKFDPVLQFTDRCVTLAMNGHPVDKIELLILGGTWTSYPHQYQETFIRDLFFAANTFFDRPHEKRLPLPLRDEKLINETSKVKIIGITLETRPDCIDLSELRRMRSYGCTRVQLGMQHTDDGILTKINRGCTRSDMVRAVRLLKDTCFKLDIHMMPNLPGANLALDRDMFDQVLEDDELQVDQWKIYPCEITPWTVIKKWFEEGSYVPYPDSELIMLLKEVLPRVPPWVRVNRVVRDIPSQYILAGMDRPNLRQDVDEELRIAGIECHDIRHREVKGQKDLTKEAVLVQRTYNSSGGIEHFLSFETPDHATIFAFTRLRLCHQSGGIDDGDANVHESGRKKRNAKNQEKRNLSSPFSSEDLVFSELSHCALIRELHVYGQLATVDLSVKDTNQNSNDVGDENEQQHVGFGTRLMRKAEEISAENGFSKVAVISGVGVRNFYRKLGYEYHDGLGEFMMKEFTIQYRLKHQKKLKFFLFAFVIIWFPILLSLFLFFS